MKNLKKLSKQELKSIQGGVQTCEHWMPVCPCRPGYFRCNPNDPNEVCKPNGTICS